jgi:hypothetical protein
MSAQAATMARATATVATSNASRYLQQLCKHWGHRFEVAFTPAQGSIPFGEARRCDLAARDGRLHMTVEAPDEAARTRLETVVADHLRRFAFREQLGPIVWRTDGLDGS